MEKHLKNGNYRQSYIIAIFVIVILTICSVILYRERMLFVDPVWIAFNIINTKSFVFAEHRYGAFITQMFPLVGVYLGLSLKTILIIYSLSFYLFYLSVACIVGFVLKQKWLGILLALYLTLFISDAYFWTNNEVHQGITWMFLSIGLYQYLNQKSQNNIIGYFFAFLFGVLAISSHLLVSVPFLFIWILIKPTTSFFNVIKDKKYWIGTLVILILIFLRYKLSNAGWYDPGKLKGVNNFTLQSIVTAFQSGQSKSFFALLLHNYWVAIVILVLSFGVLIVRKKYLQLSAFILFVLGYYVLICITFPEGYGRELRFYMESEWAGLSIIISAPIVFYLYQINLNYRIISLITCVVFGVRLAYIYDAYSLFHQRYLNLEYVTNAMHEKGISKLIIIEDKSVSENKFIMDWGLPVESMALSQIEGKAVQSTFKIAHETLPLMYAKDSFYSCFSIENTKKLHTQYFALDSTQYYQYIEGLELLLKKK